jgi:ATP-dependent Zn protease
MITELEKKAEDVLSKNRDKLDALTEQLLARETLSRKDIDQLLQKK